MIFKDLNLRENEGGLCPEKLQRSRKHKIWVFTLFIFASAAQIYAFALTLTSGS